MSRNINLFRNKKSSGSAELISKILQILLIISLFITASSAIIMFFLRINSNLEQLVLQENKLLEKFYNNKTSFKTRMIKYFKIKNRLAYIPVILKNRTPKEDDVIILLINKPSSLKISGIKIKNKEIDVNLSSESLSSLDLFLTNIKKLEFDKDRKDSYIELYPSPVLFNKVFNRVLMKQMQINPDDNSLNLNADVTFTRF